MSKFYNMGLEQMAMYNIKIIIWIGVEHLWCQSTVFCFSFLEQMGQSQNDIIGNRPCIIAPDPVKQP